MVRLRQLPEGCPQSNPNHVSRIHFQQIDTIRGRTDCTEITKQGPRKRTDKSTSRQIEHYKWHPFQQHVRRSHCVQQAPEFRVVHKQGASRSHVVCINYEWHPAPPQTTTTQFYQRNRPLQRRRLNSLAHTRYNTASRLARSPRIYTVETHRFANQIHTKSSHTATNTQRVDGKGSNRAGRLA